MKYIVMERPAVDEALITSYRRMEDVLSLSCVISDAMGRECTMDPEIKPRAADKKIIGPAITVKLTPGDIVDCLGVFEIARPGDVVVIEAFGEKFTSIWGGLMSGLARKQADLEIRQREAILRGATAEELLREFGRI